MDTIKSYGDIPNSQEDEYLGCLSAHYFRHERTPQKNNRRSVRKLDHMNESKVFGGIRKHSGERQEV
jgi:hypothetical protein